MAFSGAVLRESAGRLAIESLDLRNVAAGDVIVRVRASSLCHTDLEAITGALGTPLPFVPGHEAAGTVEWVGADVRQVQPGDHVVLSWNPFCGSCYFCARQQPIVCGQYRQMAARSFHFDGTPRVFASAGPVHQLMYAGSFAEMVVVTEACAVKIPRELPFDIACLIGCGVMTGVGAVLNIAKVPAGARVAVIGCGAVGLSAIQGARLAGASMIAAIDRVPGKIAFSMQFGATLGLVADGSVVESSLQATDGIGFDFVIESAGSESAFQTSLDILRPGGQVVWLGKLPLSQRLSLRWGSLMGERKIHRSSYGGANPGHDFPLLAAKYLSGDLHLDPYITGRIGLAQVNEGLQQLRDGLAIRTVIEFP